MKVLRYLTYFLPAAAIALLVCSCGAKPPVTVYSPRQIAEVIIAAQENIPVLNPLAPDDDYFYEYLTEFYQINGETIQDGIIFYAIGMLADEIAVFRVSDGAANDVKEALLGYIGRRTAAFTGYAPTQAAIVENGVVSVHGNYVALLICQDTKSAQASFFACFSNDPPDLPDINDLRLYSTEEPDRTEETPEPPRITPTPDVADSSGVTEEPEATDGSMAPEEPEATDTSEAATEPGTTAEPEITIEPEDTDVPETSADPGATAGPDATAEPETPAEPESTDDPDTNSVPADVYDRAAILAVWRGGDVSALSEKNRRIYDACVGVIGRLITSGMSDYEKELAIHDWIINWARYDTEVNNNSPYAKPDPDNDNPYGLLINKRAICRGFTATFQLFMDMVGVECITVDGMSHNGAYEHAWNMVRIDGEWYCVDVTWNNPADSNPETRDPSVTHRFFNVTSQFMWDTSHRWDRSSTPEATAPKLYY